MLSLEVQRMMDKIGVLPSCMQPGMYPIIYHTGDGATICPDCANGKNGAMFRAEGYDCKEWTLAGHDVHYEGPPIQCEHCLEYIESAHGEPVSVAERIAALEEICGELLNYACQFAKYDLNDLIARGRVKLVENRIAALEDICRELLNYARETVRYGDRGSRQSSTYELIERAEKCLKRA